jgi:hypothetical protein
VKDKELWERLQAYAFPLSAGRGSLREHLAGKTNLGADKAPRVVDEYRRFLYLAATSQEVVAPSPLIDRVWHTHINDTRAYVEDFAGKVIGRMIHHSPGRANAADDPAYGRTLVLYEQEFGEAPFAQVWPQPEWLRRGKWGRLAIIAAFIAIVLSSFTFRSQLPFIGWLLVLVVAVQVTSRWGYWSVEATTDGSGCSSCSSGDGGGCGGD